MRTSSRKIQASKVEVLEGRWLLTAVIVNTNIDGIFPPNTGLISLRSAIATANASATPTTITFDPKVFAKAQTIKLNGNNLEMSNSSQATTIAGPAAGVTLDGNQQSVAFKIDIGVMASLSHVTVRNSTNGGISNSGVLAMARVIVSGNSVANSSAGIFNSGTITLVNVTVSGNTESGNYDLGAGGIYNNGTAILTNVTISGNTASSPYGGGGIYNNGKATLNNVTVSGNTTSAGYGAGGGIFNSGAMTLTNVTISGNSVSNGNSGVSGGICNLVNAPGFTIINSIVAGNTAGSAPDVNGSFNSLGYNLIGKTDGSTGFNGADRTGTIAHPLNAKLGPLASNGGSTLTLLPLTGSPAIDHGSNALIPAGIKTDQRGLARIVGGIVDIGAVEVQQVVVPPTASITGRVFNDANGNGLRDIGEIGLGLWTVYIDANKNGKLDAGEKKATTDVGGNWSFTALVAGSYTLRVVPISGNAATKPTGGVLVITLGVGKMSSGNLFGERSVA